MAMQSEQRLRALERATDLPLLVLALVMQQLRAEAGRLRDQAP